MDQKHLAGSQPGRRHQIRPDRTGRLRQRGSVAQLDSGGQRHDLTGGHSHVLGVASPGEQCANLLSGNESGDITADGGDRSRHLQADDVAGPGRRRILSGGLQQVRPIDPRRGHGDQHLAGSGDRIGDVSPE